VFNTCDQAYGVMLHQLCTSKMQCPVFSVVGPTPWNDLFSDLLVLFLRDSATSASHFTSF